MGKTKKEAMDITPSTKKYDNIEIPIREGTSAFTPTNAKKFIDHQNILKTIALGIKDNKHVLIIGDSGLGKTSSIRYLAQETNTPLRRINLNGGTTADELIGRNGINEKGTYWIDGILTECMRKGYWLILDEINAALAEVTFLLHSLLDDDGFIVLTEKPDREIVRKHPNFRIFATCNPPEYAGTKEMNTALLSRFHICIYAQFPNAKIEKEIIKEHLGAEFADNIITDKLLKVAEDTRINKKEEKIDYCINTRDILNTLSLCTEYSPTEALDLAFTNKLNKEDREAFKQIAKLQLPARKINLQERSITELSDLNVAQTYVLYKGSVSGIAVKQTEKIGCQEDLSKTLGNGEKVELQKEARYVIKNIMYGNDQGLVLTSKKKEKPMGITMVITTGAQKDKEIFTTDLKSLLENSAMINI
jgi:cobaltochelatase CobS